MLVQSAAPELFQKIFALLFHGGNKKQSGDALIGLYVQATKLPNYFHLNTLYMQIKFTSMSLPI